MNRSSDLDNHSSGCDGEGHSGGGGTLKFLMTGERVSQSVSSDRGRCGFRVAMGRARSMDIGTCLEPIEGREDSQLCTIGTGCVLANGRSITEERALPARENWVYSPAGFMSAMPAPAAFSKYGTEELSSWDENERVGSERGLWMLRSPTTRRRMLRSRKRVSGETELIRCSKALVQ